MSGNRVEELEAKVRDLEATVEGLTDELIETKERLGAVEDETGIEPDALVGRGAGRDRLAGADSAADADGEPESDEGPATDADTDTEAEADPEAESEEGTTDSDSGDDIIVA
jgi:hypothetical protein